ncbi:MAG: 50S ribosomal protein L3 [candidate division WS6 bacterium 34_10]|uniref:50S ribosomal protein L3 n=1 Tax=candidate division WS6 bacterium 34_10 TaxID=1641389 RepID=A0A101HIF2_9BACT|nr:MAG: 50S ribosomal protein L3 [candidate division WS6 bacterium 34_10]
MKAILGIKKGMTRVFKDQKMVPVTIIDTSSCKVSGRKGNQVELGLLEKKKATKAELGTYKDLKYVPRFRKVFTGEFGEEVSIGDEVKPEFFDEGEKVYVTAKTKGKGFQGVMKRWGFKGGQRTHGQSDRLRAPGSIGAGTDPGRVWKGKKMGGRMGGKTQTFRDREVIGINDQYLLISGPVPGSNGTLVSIYTKE